MKKNKNLYVELFCIFTITLLFNLLCNPLNSDEIWNYGFAYNISNGLIPYRDFNMVITPFFPFLSSIFLIIFGKSLFIYHIFNAIICTIIFYFMKKNINKSYYIVYSLLLLFSLPNYSLFSILLLYILIYLEDNKKSDILIGVLLGLTFLTKQNIGIMLIIPSLFIKEKKKIKNRALGFIVPNIIFLIYLIFTDSLLLFIDYAFLGLSSFASENIVISIWGSLTVVSIIYLLYEYIIKKDIKILYLLCFQILAYPMFDTYHVMIPFIPVLGYYLSHLNLVVKVTQITFCVFVGSIFIYNISNIINGTNKFPNDTYAYKFRPLDDITSHNIKRVAKYLKENKNVYIINANAYVYKLEANIPINKYDLLNDGNLGKNGDIKIIKDLDNKCKKDTCTFLMREDEIGNNTLSQTNQNIIKYIDKNYKKVGNIVDLTIYRNEV